MEDLSDYLKLKDAAHQFYYKVGGIFSPALNNKIIFSAEGFNHIIFSDPRSERERSSQILRFKLLPLAKKLIEKSTTYQEFEETVKDFIVKRHKKKIKESKVVQYWGIIAIVDTRKIKVIIRRIGEGFFHFWSVIPAWTTNKYRDTKFFTTMKGCPEKD